MGFDNLKLEKGMYREAGKSFTQVLEGIDPSDQYKGTSLEGTDAFQRQLKRFDIKVKGAYSDPVEKFFRTMDSAVLFPEYIARAVRTGMEEGDILPKITATTTTIDSMDYRSVYSVPSEEDKKLSRVAEGAAIPATEVKTKENLVQLNKRGRMLIASYEAIRFQKLDLSVKRSPHIISRFPRQPDDQIGIDGFDAAVPYQVCLLYTSRCV